VFAESEKERELPVGMKTHFFPRGK